MKKGDISYRVIVLIIVISLVILVAIFFTDYIAKLKEMLLDLIKFK